MRNEDIRSNFEKFVIGEIESDAKNKRGGEKKRSERGVRG